jgi:hypothetical protein
MYGATSLYSTPVSAGADEDGMDDVRSLANMHTLKVYTRLDTKT